MRRLIIYLWLVGCAEEPPIYQCNLLAQCPQEGTHAIGHVEADTIDEIQELQEQWLLVHCDDSCTCRIDCQ